MRGLIVAISFSMGFSCHVVLAQEPSAAEQSAAEQSAAEQSAAVQSAAVQSAAERSAVQEIQAVIAQAGASYGAGNYDDAGVAIEKAMRQIESAIESGSPQMHDALLPMIKRVTKAHTMLAFEGVSLPPFRTPERLAASGIQPMSVEPRATQDPKPKPPPRKREPSKPKPVPETMISFTETVAPILVNRCGKCHVSSSKGKFNMASYSVLMKGPPEGVVVFAGDTVGSRLIETIESGDMPRGGGKVSPQELNALKAWIMAGAKFDGADPTAPIGAMAAPSTTANSPSEVRRATGSETVSFAKDVAPLLIGNCNGCHIDATRTSGGLQMDTFARLLRGGDSGAVIVPGKGGESLLVQKLRGMVGERMPAGGRPPLSDESILLISKWIDEGATLDGASADQSLRVMSKLAWVASASDSEVTEKRRDIAAENMKLVTTSSGILESKSSEHFYVFGLASSATLDMVAKQAEDQMKMVRTVVQGKQGEAFFRGKATIFVLPRRYDYSEFAKMVEARSVPADWSSHWQFDGVDAYVAMVATDRDEENEIADRLSSPLVSLAIATRGGDVPRWLAEGVGTATTSRKRGADREERRRMEMEVSQALAAMGSAKEFLSGKLTPKQTDRIGAAIATSFLDRTNRRNFDGLIRSLESGKSFEQAFAETFRATPEAFIDRWLKWARGG